jgi:toxin HigB-1
MIESFAHKGLELLYKEDSHAKITFLHKPRLKRILTILDLVECLELFRAAETTYKLHPLLGQRENTWAVKVDGAWRVTFQVEDGNTYDLNYEQYH